MAGFIPDSLSQDWCTPEWILAATREAMGVTQIDLDPCSNDTSLVKAKVEYKVPQNDGLQDSWDFPTIFVNPPFGTSKMHRKDRTFFMEPKREKGEKSAWSKLTPEQRAEYVVTDIGDWLARCAQAAQDHGSQVIALVPVTPETRGWLKSVWPLADGIGFFKKRVKFIDFHTKVECKAVIPKPMAVIYWAGAAGGEGFDRFEAAFAKTCNVIAIGPTKEAVSARLASLLSQNASLGVEVERLEADKALNLEVKAKAIDTRNASILTFEGEGVRDIEVSVMAKLRQRLIESKLVPTGTPILLLPDVTLAAESNLQPVIDKLCKLRDDAILAKLDAEKSANTDQTASEG